MTSSEKKVKMGVVKTNNTPPSKTCLNCNILFFKKAWEGNPYWSRKMFCSPKCRTDASIGRPVWNSDRPVDRDKYPNMGHFQKHTKESLEKITAANRINAKKHPKSFFQENQKKAVVVGKLRGSYHGTLGKTHDKSSSWLGDKATYNSKHRWIQKHWTRTGICQRCGIKTIPFGKRHFGTEWHNLDGVYNREDKNTWIEVCSKCHKSYARQNKKTRHGSN